jgi:hypothetical protein
MNIFFEISKHFQKTMSNFFKCVFLIKLINFFKISEHFKNSLVFLKTMIFFSINNRRKQKKKKPEKPIKIEIKT